ncbi:L-type lectin-domain containing receptor kinase SIT2-like [Aristolochia californica]|uniref:L-type lectin-domain containing receptor kinase SIT2-like n=1 Tax=Aristolochia californica TaxID=171875 RepID=UPI0035E18575
MVPAAMNKILVVFLVMRISVCVGDEDIDFVYNGFLGSNLTINGVAKITQNGLLQLTNTTAQNQIGHAFFPTPLSLKDTGDGKRTPISFSTTFVIAIVPEDPDSIGNGMAFVISPSTVLLGSQPSQYLGLFNLSNNGNSSNNITAIEFDTISSPEFEDVDDDHVGIDVNSLRSVISVPTAYFGNDNGHFQNLSLKGGYPLQVWVEYSSRMMLLNVTVSTINTEKPSGPLLSTTIDLSTVTFDSLYVGFSASTGPYLTSHYVLGWSFKTNGQARPLDTSQLPRLPPSGKKSKYLKFVIPSAIAALLVVMIIVAAVFGFRRRKRFAEVLEGWERQIGAHRISYKDLYAATKGFKDSEVIGAGGFGKVYKGVLPVSKNLVAVKKITHESEEGMRQFLAEVTSIGRIRHRNFVELQGYCRRKGELLLVYEYMQNSSLDKFLYGQPRSTLNWAQRFRIIKQVGSGLFYLHECWTQTVLHRDIKASNVLLDRDFNGRLGDFGLSRLYDHGSDPLTTRLVGTIGYIAPELNRTGRATKSTDIYAFGVFLLEVVCGRRPIDLRAPAEQIILMDWVTERLSSGRILEVVDRKLGHNLQVEEKEEMGFVLRVGLLCLKPKAEERPSMEQVVQFLDNFSSLDSFRVTVSSCQNNGSENLFMSAPPLESVSVLVSGH